MARPRGLTAATIFGSLPAMLNVQDPEERKIRILLISGSVLAALSAFAFSVAVAVFASLNFNPLEWME